MSDILSQFLSDFHKMICAISIRFPRRKDSSFYNLSLGVIYRFHIDFDFLSDSPNQSDITDNHIQVFEVRVCFKKSYIWELGGWKGILL